MGKGLATWWCTPLSIERHGALRAVPRVYTSLGYNEHWLVWERRILPPEVFQYQGIGLHRRGSRAANFCV